MNLILTHEQADFDALAALVAARLLDPEARAVLPRRLNRNLRAFLTLYGDRLPLTPFEDLPRQKIDRLTLVDTQTPPSLKGLRAATQVHIVDHHPKSDGLDRRWTTHVAEVGATTTLLAETLQEASAQLDPVEATLLLIGIYEDTGSLSYSGTTARDVRAAAWLLEQGASLSVAADFLNPPLTPGQRRLHDRLVASAETVVVHGASIVVACAEAPDPDDEISTLAHRLLDLFDPAGLFLLVGLDGHVQMVARSTTDSVDVGRICDRFGGGGHGRAAAALILDRSPDMVRTTLLDLLPDMVTPGRTVGDIMSSIPQLLEPETPVHEAAERMQRFGHEGYPVVERGRVIGLLTRRAVDRAMGHGLGAQPVRTVMDPGDLVARPDEPVENLQRAMIERGWGQVAVVEDERVVGIVTRTDLLRSLTEFERERPEMGRLLEHGLPPARRALLNISARVAAEQRLALYLVGGIVRDLLLGLPGADFDLVVEGDAIALARALASAYGGRVSAHRRFGTAKWRLDPGDRRVYRALAEQGVGEPDDLPAQLDLVSARAEFYTHPTALPSVQPGSIRLDLHRRDFSINTLAIRLDGVHYGHLLDPWGGGRDLAARRIRALHSISFIDDPTRMLRAVRLEHRLGFEIEPRTFQLLERAVPLLARVSGERIRGELELIFAEPERAAMMGRLEDLGLLAAIHPDLTWDAWLADRFQESRDFVPDERWRLASPPESDLRLLLLWTIRLSPDQAQAAAGRLRLSRSASQAIRSAATLFATRSQWSGDTVLSRRTRRLEEHPEASLVGVWLAAAGEPEVRGAIYEHLARLRFVAPVADGHALQRRGLPPGPRYAQVLSELRDGWLDGRIRSPEEEAEALDRMLAAEPADG